MEQQTKKYHTSDNGRIYRINDDGSYTEIGNVNNLTKETTSEVKNSKKINWIKLIGGIIGLVLGTILLYNSGGIYSVIICYVILALINFFYFRKKGQSTQNINHRWRWPRILFFVFSIIIFCIIKFYKNEQDYSSPQVFIEDSNSVEYVDYYEAIDSTVYLFEDSISY